MRPPYGQLDTSRRLHNPGPVLTFAILQVIFGIGLIISDIVSLSVALGHAFIFSAGVSGIWTGILFIITGSFGIASGKPLPAGTHPSSRKCFLITSMVMSILSTIAAFSMLITFTIFLIVLQVGGFDFGCIDRPIGSYCPYRGWYRDMGNGLMGANLTFHVILFVASLGQSISAGINMCKLRSPTSTVQYVFTQPASPGFYPGGPAVVYNMPYPYTQPVYTVPSQPPLYGVQTLNPAHLQDPQKP